MQETTFWGFITSSGIKKICIPTIQRDYAQGRKEKVYLRYNFLNALKSAMCGTDKQLSLDFVYGVCDNGMFVPLDGQQRLTTLWLLHWFMAYKTGLLQEAKVYLNKFSYETRMYSAVFCQKLCDLSHAPENVPLRDWITQQTWFYNQYKQDPTIMGMLNMIGGTDNPYNIPDGLEKLFKDDECNYENFWKRLTESSCIKFEMLNVTLDDSDELYVKMNARGRQLADFENFKAELVRYVMEDELLDENESLAFAAKLDVDWTDIFWKNRWVDDSTNAVSIDEIYFAFIRRFVRLEYIRRDGDNCPHIQKISRDFTSFDPYEEILTKQSILDLIKIMDNLRGHELQCKSSWGSVFEFVPRYIGRKEITTNDRTKNLLFYGCCRYLLQGEFDEESFAEWNRILWNICENRADTSLLLPTMREIDILASHSHDILKYLAENEIDCIYNKKQLSEEQSKARHIQQYPSIRDLEGWAFFKGAIRFLFTGPDGNDDWDSFEEKARNVKKLIPQERENRHTIKRFVPYVSENALCVIFHKWASNNDEDLRDILLYDKALPFLHNFFLQNNNKESSALHNDIQDICEDAYGGRGYLQSDWEESKYIWTNYQKRSGYYEWSSYVVGDEDHRRVSEILLKLYPEIEIRTDLQSRKIGNHIPSFYIQFKYYGHCFTLYSNDTVCVMTENWEDKMQNPDDPQGYYFLINDIETEEQLICQLDKRINNMQNDYRKV